MTRYYPASSQPAGKALSEAMWQLCLPLDQRQPNDTNQAFEVLLGANGQTYVNMPDDFAAALHPEADAAPVAALLQPYENAGHMPAGTTAALVAWVNATRVLPTPEERTFVLWDKFPDYFKNLSLTSLPAEALPDADGLGTLYGLDNAGTVYDGGGNVSNNKTNTKSIIIPTL